MINETPRSDSFKPIDPKRTHEQRQLVNNFRDTLQKAFPAKQETDVDRLVRTLRAIIANRNQFAVEIVEVHRTTGKLLDRDQLKSEVEKQYLESLNIFSKDELHLLFTMVLTDLTLKNSF